MTPFIIFFLILAVVFNLAGNLGLLLFPDVYTRLQISALCATTSVISVFIACMLIAGFSPKTGKILVITFFFFISSPVSSHIVARYAWNKEMVPWRKIAGTFQKKAAKKNNGERS